MATYHVTPADDKWQVRKENVGVVSAGHYKKSGAKREAYSRAEAGDEVVLHGLNGRVQESRTVR